MSSSISSSDAGSWRRFLAVYLAAALVGGGLLVGALCLVDPYDTGRFGGVEGVGVPRMAPRMANASRGRDPRFDSAVIGNSHAQLLMPERLSALSGRRFVSLTIPGTGPLEQLAVARWFAARHGTRTGALVIGLDRGWCEPEGALVPPNPFPFWLYSRDTAGYLAGLLKADSLNPAVNRLKLFAGLVPAARADGYDDYEQGRVWREAEVLNRVTEPSPWAIAAAPDRPGFPGAELLRGFLAELPPDVPVVLAFPPVHARVLPAPDSPGGRVMTLCKQTFRALAAARRGTAVVDMLEPGELADRTENFWDQSHYRADVARMLEDRIAAALPRAGVTAEARLPRRE